MLITRVQNLAKVWLLSYEEQVLNFLLVRPNVDLAVFDVWLEQADLLNQGGGKVDPLLLPVHLH